MEKGCHECGSPVGAEQAFCPKCGAVIGMNPATAEVDDGWDMASTMMGRRAPAAPPPRASAERRAQPDGPEAATPRPAGRGGKTMLLAVLGFVAVLLVG
ncbi:MAG TPA: zinc-ribbon domain-containing protein, partial [Pyrinomonadaceae bacterium]